MTILASGARPRPTADDGLLVALRRVAQLKYGLACAHATPIAANWTTWLPVTEPRRPDVFLRETSTGDSRRTASRSPAARPLDRRFRGGRSSLVRTPPPAGLLR